MSDLTAASLDDGAWTLTESRRACDVSRRLRVEACALLVTYRAHRFRAIFGASDANRREGLRPRLATFAAGGPVKTYVGPSRGAACDVCGERIFVGEIEYEVVAEGRELRLDAACYLILVDEAARLQPEG